jgi:hypothetical protein
MKCPYLIINPDSDNESCTCKVSPKKGELPDEMISKYCKGVYEDCQRYLYRTRLMGREII